ncbi:MAG: hypothetical protein ACE5JH_01760 [Acidobacteriota bacterium]
MMPRPGVDASAVTSGLAARLLESQLLRLTRAGAVIERRLGRGLYLMSGEGRFRRLGYVRLADYLTERLGMSLRRAQSLLRMDRALRVLPHVARAFDAGDLPPSKLRVIAAASTAATQALWLARARRLTVRELEDLARVERRQTPAPEGPGSAGRRPPQTPADPGCSQPQPGREPDDPARLPRDPDAAPDGATTTTGETTAETSLPHRHRAAQPAAPQRHTSAPQADAAVGQDDPGRFISFKAPGQVVALWHWALDLIRRVAGHQEPAWRCAEYLAADFLSGVPDVKDAPDRANGTVPLTTSRNPGAAGAIPSPPADALPAPTPGTTIEPDGAGPGTDAAPPPPPAAASEADRAGGGADAPRPSTGAAEGLLGLRVWSEVSAVVREALSPLGSAADPESILAGRAPEIPPDPGSSLPAGALAVDSRADALGSGARSGAVAPGQAAGADGARAGGESAGQAPDPWDLDARLRGLVRLRQSLAWRQGRLLATLAGTRLYRDLGSDSLGDWCRAALGMSPRRARYLIALDRRLRSLPLLADAYRRGLITWCHARHLVRVVRPETQGRWIRYARRVTVRRLEEVVALCDIATAMREDATAPPAAAPADPPAAPPAATRPPVPSGTRAPAPSESASGPPVPDTGDTPAAPAPEAAHICALARTLSWDGRSGAPLPPADPSPRPGTARHTSARPKSPAPAAAADPTGQADRRGRTQAWWWPIHRISFWAPTDVAALWHSALRACRGVAGRDLRDWECLVMLIRSLRETWDNPGDAGWRRRYRIFERDGWRCRVPGCSSRSNLNEHHIIFRSRGGGDEDDNLITLCVGHHQRGIHQGWLRCSGRANSDLWWELGVRPDGPPLARYLGESLRGTGRAPRDRAPVGGTPGSREVPAPALALVFRDARAP